MLLWKFGVANRFRPLRATGAFVPPRANAFEG